MWSFQQRSLRKHIPNPPAVATTMLLEAALLVWHGGAGGDGALALEQPVSHKPHELCHMNAQVVKKVMTLS